MAKFFTKKVLLIMLAVVLAGGGIVWAIVANLTPQFRSGFSVIPEAIYVSGNGSAAVMVDNYLYFVGDTVTTSDIKYGDNEYYAKGTMPDSGIFRVKIGEDNQPVLTYKYDNSYVDETTGETTQYQVGDDKYNTVVSEIVDWENIGKKNNGIEAVVPKIAGHDKTAMWVFGKYLIYTSPHNRYDNRGNLMSDYLDFFRVDLNGENNTLIYTTESTDLTTKNFTVWADARNKIYLLVSETDNGNETPEPKIKKINVNTKVVTVLDSNVSNVVLPIATQYGKQNESMEQVYGGVMGYVYYTKSRGENSTLKGNLLYRCAINGGEPEIIADRGDAEKGTTFTPLAVTPMDTDGAHASAQFVFAISVATSNATFIEKDLCVITNQNMDNFHYTDPETDGEGLGLKSSYEVGVYANGFCTIDKKLYHYSIDGSRVILDKENGATKILSSSVDSVLAVMGDTIYVQSGNSVYAVKQNGNQQTVTLATTTTTSESSEDSTDSTSSSETKTNTMPISIHYQPQGNTGDVIIFVATANDLRLYHLDGTNQYLRMKADA